ncbi:hypothetical protein DVH07_04235 [Hafnia paralvei]|uniref:AAA family ATPase n=1 Tax=Hafnia paralvei TaxID=546367 RepID=UPI000DF26860|nr:AAA family ATPase [Hafnia paralvei]RDA70472.1 hypothetical protein DU449_04565 [Hafnia paralvei]RDA71374.1 hypothetical protein DVH09_04620 [Hafnia paralvei]RDA72492.1 hypothetical protein DVH08_03805 [Hafnia paralvei]RDA80580.1 hypothetical protein DVH10_04250 [Hafnia paralvei]RDA80965.1 hypothetical protein DVH07_04235 [Hafnia paralvei]
MEINNITIKNLYGEYDCSLDIRDNKFILVGENGTGKSTILAFLYYILDRKWNNLLEYEFDEASIKLYGDVFNFSKKDVASFLGKDRVRRKNLILKDEISNFVNENLSTEDNERAKNDVMFLDQLSYRVNRHLRQGLNISFPSEVIRSELLEVLFLGGNNEAQSLKNPIRKLDVYLKRKLSIPIIYLPTYRRIEHDLQKIMPEFSRDAFERRHVFRGDSRRSGELVNFGMSDVDLLVKDSMESLSSEFRNGMKELIGQYLQDVLMHRYDHSVLFDNFDFKNKNLDSILARVDGETLSQEIKEEIRRKISSSISSDSGLDTVVKYFIHNLVKLDEIQTQREECINKFVKICNSYLVNKEIVFDQIRFEIYIKIIKKEQKSPNEKINWDVLSSGEKQIVSLFAKLILGKKDEFILVIDEPELSLSIVWQRKFLMDISTLNNCSGLFCVTHSPFIYTNELKKYAQAMGRVLKIK